MGRPKKYESSTHLGLRIEKDIKELAKKKADRKGDNLSDLVQSFLKTYIDCNTPIEKLEEKIREQRERTNEEKQKLKVLERELEKEKEKKKIYFEPNEINYLQTQFEDLSSETQITRIRGMADRKGVDPKELEKKAKEQIDGFNGISGEAAMDM